MFHHIIDMTDHQGDDTFNALMDSRDTDGLIAYLSQWDYGDYSSVYDPIPDNLMDSQDVSYKRVEGSGYYAIQVDYPHGTATLWAHLEDEV